MLFKCFFRPGVILNSPDLLKMQRRASLQIVSIIDTTHSCQFVPPPFQCVFKVSPGDAGGHNAEEQCCNLVPEDTDLLSRWCRFNARPARQRTLTVGGSITVCLASSLTRLDLINKQNMLLLVCSETVESKLLNLEASHTKILPLTVTVLLARWPMV